MLFEKTLCLFQERIYYSHNHGKFIASKVVITDCKLTFVTFLLYFTIYWENAS